MRRRTISRAVAAQFALVVGLSAATITIDPLVACLGTKRMRTTWLVECTVFPAPLRTSENVAFLARSLTEGRIV